MMPCLFYAAGFDITGTQNFIAYGKLRRRGAEIARSEVVLKAPPEVRFGFRNPERFYRRGIARRYDRGR
jgi:hypothetical protein